MNCTPVFTKNIQAYNKKYRRIVNHGGTSSSKNFSILQLLLLIAIKKQGALISVMSETMPHLKMGAIRDFENILREDQIYDERNINRSDHRYSFGKSTIEFFSADSIGKTTGPRRNILYVNECINIAYPIIEQAELRTDDCIFYDYNPDHQFWITDKVFSLPDSERCIIKSNYLNNNQLKPSIVREIEMKASRDENFKRIHIDLEFGISEGLIFPDFRLVDSMPETFSKQIHGMDFGFTNDPSTLIDIRLSDGQLWMDELLYRTAMTNGDIIKFLKSLNFGRKQIVADSSEPKSIREIELAGFSIIGADKGPDSIRIGIDRIKSYPINVTKQSVNLIKEFRNYKWKVDKKSGQTMNEPIDFYNHCIDCIRYAVMKITNAPAPARYTFKERS